MTKKLEINFTKKPEMVFQFDQFLNVEQAVAKFLNKKENLERLIAPLIPTNLEDTIQKLIPEVKDGKTPIKGVDYNDGEDGKDGETPDEETLLKLIKTQIPKPIPGNDGKTPKKGIDYFTKKELEDIKKGLKEAIMSEMTNHVTKEEVHIKLEEIKKQVNSLPQSGGAQFLRQLMDVNVGTPTAQQYGLTYNPSRSEFSLTSITGGGSSVSVNGVEVTDPNFEDTAEIAITTTGSDVNFAIVAGSIDETKLDASVNASLDLADSALQAAAIGVSVQAYSSVLANTTASFTTADETKLDNITVTQAVNLDTMESDIAALANGMVYKGNWDASAGTFPGAGSAQTGWFYTVSVGGTVDSVVFNVDDRLVATTDNASATVYAGNWTKLDATDAVTSVFGRTGNVTATSGDYNAGQITNTPAGNISATDVQAAINELDTEKQPLDTQLTSLAGLSYASNALKVVRVNAGETDFELATISSSGATTALDNLASVAINTSLVSDTDNTDDLGTTLIKWANLFVTTIGATATRVTKGWLTDVESTNMYTVGGTSLSSIFAAIAGSLSQAFSVASLEVSNTDTTITRASAGDINVEGNIVYRAGGTDVTVTDGGTGRSTSTTAYGLIAAGTTATGAYQTLATGSTGQILQSAGASALPTYSTATYPATAGTPGNVLTSDGTNFVSSAPAGGTPKITISTDYAAGARYTSVTAGGGALTYDDNPGGVRLQTSASGGGRAKIYWGQVGGVACAIDGTSFSSQMTLVVNGTDYDFYHGLSDLTLAAAGITFTGDHIGFKITRAASGSATLYATTASAATETATSLTTLVVNDTVEVMCVINSTSSIDFYYRKNGAAISSATNISTNIPSTCSLTVVTAITNKNVASAAQVGVIGSTLLR